MQSKGFDNIQYYKTGGSNPDASQGTSLEKTGYNMQYNSAQEQIYSTPSPPQGVMVTQPTAMAPATIQHYSNWMVPAIFVTICCFLPTGIFAIIYAKMAKHAAHEGDSACAASYTQKAKIFVIVSCVLGIIIIIPIVVRYVHPYTSYSV